MNIKEIQGGFWVPDDSHVGKWQIETQRLSHDEFTVPAALSYIELGDTVIDIGAFNGDHSIEYARHVGPSGKVVCVEPGEVAFRCLEHNIQLFQNRNSTAVRCALGNEKGFASHMQNFNLGASTCQASTNGDVPIITLDELFEREGLKWVHFIKMDCEGWEPKVIYGGLETINRCRPTMLIEVNISALRALGFTPCDIFNPLNEFGYNFFMIQNDVESYETMYDVICQVL